MLLALRKEERTKDTRIVREALQEVRSTDKRKVL